LGELGIQKRSLHGNRKKKKDDNSDSETSRIRKIGWQRGSGRGREAEFKLSRVAGSTVTGLQ